MNTDGRVELRLGCTGIQRHGHALNDLTRGFTDHVYADYAIIRSIAPDCELYSVRVSSLKNSGI